MPASASDRLTTTHERVYLFTRSPRYFFDLDPIRQPLVSSKRESGGTPRSSYPPAGVRAANRRVWTSKAAVLVDQVATVYVAMPLKRTPYIRPEPSPRLLRHTEFKRARYVGWLAVCGYLFVV